MDRFPVSGSNSCDSMDFDRLDLASFFFTGLRRARLSPRFLCFVHFLVRITFWPVFARKSWFFIKPIGICLRGPFFGACYKFVPIRGIWHCQLLTTVVFQNPISGTRKSAQTTSCSQKQEEPELFSRPVFGMWKINKNHEIYWISRKALHNRVRWRTSSCFCSYLYEQELHHRAGIGPPKSAKIRRSHRKPDEFEMR